MPNIHVGPTRDDSAGIAIFPQASTPAIHMTIILDRDATFCADHPMRFRICSDGIF